MYLSKVELKNVQGFENLLINFMDEHNQVRKYSLFLGNNSTGKTAFLRSIALGMCDESSAAGLIEDFPYSFIRQSEKEAVVSK